MQLGDFVICNDIIGCVQSLSPLTLLCQDGAVRAVNATPTVIITGQQAALLTAEKLMRRIRDGNQSDL